MPPCGRQPAAYMPVLWGGSMFFMIVLAIIMIIYSVAMYVFFISQIMYFRRVNAETKRMEQETAETNKRYRVLL
jgi:uncharacterized membrane protein